MKNTLILLVSFVLIVTIGFVVFYKFYIPKTAYVNIDKVYNNFPLKLELEKKLSITHKERERVLDSLKSDLKLLSMNIESLNKKNTEDINLFYLKRDQLQKKEQQFNEDTEAQLLEYKNQIWKQLNQYIKEYGSEKGYDYIYGVDETYVLLYKKEEYNITEELGIYVNDRYKGN